METREYLNELVIGIIAPAGYGKTEEIVDAVNFCVGKQLILTHTRAGVAALRRRMKSKNVCSEKYEIDTIASFCLRWCMAYPATANMHVFTKLSEIDYGEIYRGTKAIFSLKWAKEVLKQTYSGIFVDEYQDCVESQHAIFCELINIIPIRFFGDPLQGIFYWVKGDTIVNWKSFPFKVISPLTVPWRWEKTNRNLGSLIDKLRQKMLPVLDGESITLNLRDIPGCMSILNSNLWNNGKYAYKIANYKSVVYLSAIKNKQESFSQHNGGFFQCDEVKDLTEVETIILSIEKEEREKKALALLESLKKMANGIQGELGSYITNLVKGKSDFSRISKHKDLGQLIKDICDQNTKQSVLNVLQWFQDNQNVFKIFRQEQFFRLGKTYAYMTEEKCTLHEAIEELGSQRYFVEKDFSFPRLSSRTVLTKGLEFECVIIDARDKMDPRDFYVAMTRAKKFIYVIADTNQLSFPGIVY